jgi:excisionase family DNA binding protein
VQKTGDGDVQRSTMSVDEAGQRLGISRNAAYQAVREGQIPSIRIGRRILVPKAAFERMLDGAEQPHVKSDG